MQTSNTSVALDFYSEVDTVLISSRVHTDIAGLSVDGTADELYDKTHNICTCIADRNAEAH